MVAPNPSSRGAQIYRAKANTGIPHNGRWSLVKGQASTPIASVPTFYLVVGPTQLLAAARRRENATFRKGYEGGNRSKQVIVRALALVAAVSQPLTPIRLSTFHRTFRTRSTRRDLPASRLALDPSYVGIAVRDIRRSDRRRSSSEIRQS